MRFKINDRVTYENLFGFRVHGYVSSCRYAVEHEVYLVTGHDDNVINSIHVCGLEHESPLVELSRVSDG